MHSQFAMSNQAGSTAKSITSGKFRLPARSVDERVLLKQKLPELLWVERIIRQFPDQITSRIATRLTYKGISFPIYQINLGAQEDSSAPILVLTGGVHGVERIGTQVLLAWLEATLNRLEWDNELANKYQNIRIIILPIVNPTGMFNNTRCNFQGVDLNRNAPLDAEGKTPFLAGGQRFTNKLAWYRGKSHTLEPENNCLQEILVNEVFNQPFAMALDLHSRFWNP